MYDFDQFLVEAEENEDLWFRAEMTHRQFASLSHKLTNSDIENEIINLDFFVNKLAKTNNLSLDEIEKWLKNSWNTEEVLNQNKIIIENTGQSFAMQWAFPQAYYSTFGSLLAHFKALGYPQESHSSVLKHFALLLEQNKFPKSVSFYCTGGKKTYFYKNIEKPNNLNSIHFDVKHFETIDNQICQFLKSTREIKLDDKAIDMKLKNRPGQKKKNLNEAKWKRVSDACGHTTIMDLLYRKRIKANYQDISTFSSAQFKGLEVLTNLSIVVNRLNLINETFIAKAIGLDKYSAMLDRHLNKVRNGQVGARFETTKLIINTINNAPTIGNS